MLVKVPGFGHTDDMTIKRFVTGMLLLAVFSLQAAAVKIPSLKVGPVTYDNVTVIGANATDLYFTHGRGIGNVKLKYLTPELQKQFHYDPKAAAEAERKQVEADTLYQSVLASNIAFQAKQARATGASTNGQNRFADPISDKSLIGKPAPALEAEKWAGEKPATDGKYVVVAFWAPWSPASLKCIPALNALQKKFAEKLVVVGVSPTPIEEGDVKVEFASALDTKAKLSSAAGVTSIPSVLLIDPKGIVRYQGHPAALDEKQMQGCLE